MAKLTRRRCAAWAGVAGVVLAMAGAAVAGAEQPGVEGGKLEYPCPR